MASALLYRVNKWGGEGEAISPDYRGRYIFPVGVISTLCIFLQKLLTPPPPPVKPFRYMQ